MVVYVEKVVGQDYKDQVVEFCFVIEGFEQVVEVLEGLIEDFDGKVV